MSVHFDSRDLELMEKALKRLEDRNHGSYDTKQIEKLRNKIKNYRILFNVK